MTTRPEPPRRRHHTLITVDSHDVDDFVYQMRRIADDAEREQRISVEMVTSTGYYYLSSENDDWLPREEYDAALIEWSEARRADRGSLSHG